MLSSTSRLSLGASTSRSLLRAPHAPRPRFASTAPPPPPPSSSTVAGKAAKPRWFGRKPHPPGWKPLYRRRPLLFSLLAVPTVITASLGIVLIGLLGYDASTYADKDLDKVQVNPLALLPARGGKKNLKVAEALVDDEDEGRRLSSKKQRLVVVGGGWGVSSMYCTSSTCSC